MHLVSLEIVGWRYVIYIYPDDISTHISYTVPVFLRDLYLPVAVGRETGVFPTLDMPVFLSLVIVFGWTFTSCCLRTSNNK